MSLMRSFVPDATTRPPWRLHTRWSSISPGTTNWLAQLGEAYALAGQVDAAREILRQLEDRALRAYVSPYHLAFVHTGLGEQERALDLLEEAFDKRAGAMYGVKGSFLLAPLRSHPRFKALLKRMNVPPEAEHA
jgi:hypothetical protein